MGLAFVFVTALIGQVICLYLLVIICSVTVHVAARGDGIRMQEEV